MNRLVLGLSESEWETVARKAHFRPSIMAALCAISLRQLERLFLDHFKEAPCPWARELRCRLAQERLANGFSTKAAAKELHFGSAAHLCHEFKRLYGIAPQTFARSCMRSARKSFRYRGVIIHASLDDPGGPELPLSPYDMDVRAR